MLIVPDDSRTAFICVVSCFLFEFFRIFAGLMSTIVASAFLCLISLLSAYLFGRPSQKLYILQNQKFEASKELSQIKSVQLEFVKHSKLTRQVIKFEKEIEALQLTHGPRFKRVKNTFRIVRVRMHLFCEITSVFFFEILF